MKKNKRKVNIRSPFKKKIILLLLTGCVFGLTLSHYHRKCAIKTLIYEWKEIDRDQLRRTFIDLEKKKIIKYKKSKNGEYYVELSTEGRILAGEIKVAELKLERQKKWDGLWRMVIFDIPEKQREIRDALRLTLLRGGFAKLQHSVLVYPFPCEKEIRDVILYYEAKSYIHYCEVSYIMNDYNIKKAFNLSVTK